MASQFPFGSIVVLANGQSITGSFYKMVTFNSGSVAAGLTEPAHFRALKDQNGNSLIPAALTNGLFLPPGLSIDALITSASLDGTSAPVLLYSI